MVNPSSERDYIKAPIGSKAKDASNFKNGTGWKAWFPVKSFLLNVAGCKIVTSKLLLQGESAAEFTCGRDSFTLRLKNF